MTSREKYELFLEESKEITREDLDHGFYWLEGEYVSRNSSAHGYRWADRLNFGFKCWEGEKNNER